MNPADRQKLKAILSAVDENFLVALANKGLLRRAQKDLEEASLSLEESDDSIVVKGADWTVWMPAAGPTKARDDTKASGVTRQILMATIYLAKTWTGETVQAGGGKTDSIKRSDAVPEVVSEGATEYVTASPVATDSSTTKSTGQTAEAEPGSQQMTTGTTFNTTTAEIASTDIAASDTSSADQLQTALLQITSELLTKWAGKKLLSDTLAGLQGASHLKSKQRLA